MKKIGNIFWQFLFLGCISFGGPAAHIGYFQRTFVERLKWLDQTSYANLISLSQFLPGPGSSQLGFAIGLRQAGIFGGIAAFVGFTLPSFLILYFFATSLDPSEQTWLPAVIHGLKLLAVVVVADACLTMFRSFCQRHIYKFVALFATMILIIFPTLISQILVLIAAAGFGAFIHPMLKTNHSVPVIVLPVNKIKILPLVLFLIMLISLPLLTNLTLLISPLKELTILFNQFYQAGSMVFGGGHVVLPLLQQTIGESLSSSTFLTGYASSQAVPGPMFTMATFLGAQLFTEQPFIGAMVATLAIFLPGFLLLIAFQGSWQSLAEKPKVASAVMAVNAAVVGLLASALYQPIFTSAVGSIFDLIAVVIGFYLLRIVKLPIIVLLLTFVALGLLLAQLINFNLI